MSSSSYEEGQSVGDNGLTFLEESPKDCGVPTALFKCRCGKTFKSAVRSVEIGVMTDCGCVERERIPYGGYNE